MGVGQSTSDNPNTIEVNFQGCKSFDEYFKSKSGIISMPKSNLWASETQVVVQQPQEQTGGKKKKNIDSLSSLGLNDDFLSIDSAESILQRTPQSSDIYPKKLTKEELLTHGTESEQKRLSDKNDDSDEDLENLDEDNFDDSTTENDSTMKTHKKVNSESSTNILPKYIGKKHKN